MLFTLFFFRGMIVVYDDYEEDNHYDTKGKLEFLFHIRFIAWLNTHTLSHADASIFQSAVIFKTIRALTL